MFRVFLREWKAIDFVLACAGETEWISELYLLKENSFMKLMHDDFASSLNLYRIIFAGRIKMCCTAEPCIFTSHTQIKYPIYILISLVYCCSNDKVHIMLCSTTIGNGFILARELKRKKLMWIYMVPSVPWNCIPFCNLCRVDFDIGITVVRKRQLYVLFVYLI